MIDIFKNINLFANVADAQIKEMSQYFSGVAQCKKGACFMEQGQEDDKIYFLLSGSVRLSLVSAEGLCVSYNDIEPYNYFGWLSAIDGNLRLTSAIANEDVSYITISANNFQRFLLADAIIRQNFMLRVAGVVRNYTKRLQVLTSDTAFNRIKLEIERRFSVSGNPVDIGTHEDFASWVGTTRETVSRAIKKLEQDGHIKKQGNMYYLERPDTNDALPCI